MRIQDKDKNTKSSSGPTATIHGCAELGDLITFQNLLAREPSLLNEKNPQTKETPLHVSSAHNNIQIVQYLLDWSGRKKVKLEAKNTYGETPLHLAAKNGCNEAAKLLIDHDADVDATTKKYKTPLHLAVDYALRTGDCTIVKMLLESDASRWRSDKEGLTPDEYIPEGPEHNQLRRLFNGEDEDEDDNDDDDDDDDEDEEEEEEENYGDDEDDDNDNEDEEDDDDHDDNGYKCSDDDQSDNGSKKNRKKIGIDEAMEELENELSKIVGLNELKTQLRKWAKGMLLDEKRRAIGTNLGPRKPPHMAFLGNPGTGKTTVARILGRLLNAVGVLPSDEVTEVQRTDLVGEYVGQTGPKTRRKIDDAEGGILFVDEAYRLMPENRTGEIDFGIEALEEIMSVMEDGKIVVIFAGYNEAMKRVIASNEGFSRRVTHIFQFDDFSPKDLAEITLVKMNKQGEGSRFSGFKLHGSCTLEAVTALIERVTSEKLRNKMNGGLVDHMLSNAKENLDSRISFDAKDEELLTITMEDLESGLQLLAHRVKV